jgi:DNA replication protein DnaC
MGWEVTVSATNQEASTTSSCEFGCNGSGYFDPKDADVPTVTVCLCWWLSSVGIPKALHGKHFDNFDVDRAFSQYRRVVSWVDGYRDGCHSLMLLGGGRGTGKTHLMAAAAIEVIRKHKRSSKAMQGTRFLLSPAFFADITTNPEGFGDRLDEAARARLLFVDDVGQADEGDPAWLRAKKRDAWFRLINHRDMNGLTTVATTNLETIPQIADVVGEAGASRLLGMCGSAGLVKFEGISDYRLRELV